MGDMADEHLDQLIDEMLDPQDVGHPAPISVRCPYCGRKAKLTHATNIYRGDPRAKGWGFFYVCRPCDARVGVHRSTREPLGTLANRELRAARRHAHAAFDMLWKGHSRVCSRSSAYAWLAGELRLTPQEAHIGQADETLCERIREAALRRLGYLN